MFKKSNSGLTLMELTAVMTVVGVIALGMGVGFKNILYHYQHDAVRQDIRHYGNIIMREIQKELSAAEKIEEDHLEGFSRLKIFYYKENLTPDMIITGSTDDGVKFNGEFPLAGTLGLPKNGQYRGENKRGIMMTRFDIRRHVDTRPNLYKFSDAYLYVNLILSLESSVYTDGKTVKEEFPFLRKTFMSSAYINAKI
ncbi:MAG: prepilin-type N-terminal cleavage/methylation domain-containing protein [Candidatus Marinimicrobia bacterium]|jgi:prepilin-type N-terminal cleavage/methylation domain-containing protein|nr:prepilin-type N-terminal cleavage/methylation domain-containing protein [Candidatus Neomarinimicrobiota bacterium]MBT3496638.1 prepilin-type N-terminal cleavage/methylation domain-containing protein [Candidatus Neomarinimicrobiota bacterium]MBT3692882.1 prepilin-type N-terminal cleavage/methylation domain-containing protein [Candidatus Neomarinimicrobiota bacterium]MBT3732809.1 prepilin-type N-terminal cleavage/methylation domain-containing protein [Candidatus Neomarinimicrobiota bacterium]M